MTNYVFHVHYADGLTKKGSLKKSEFDENMKTWLDETKNHGGDELVYLKIRKMKNSSEEM